jgi:formate hydrogenlyase transcriptional activator
LVASLREEHFPERDAELLRHIANQVAIAVENALAFRRMADRAQTLREEKLYLQDEIRTEYNFEEIIGDSTSLRRILDQLQTVAPTDSTILILGETGTGKELIARAIHHLSARREKTLVKVNCAAIPTGLLKSELFGHERRVYRRHRAAHREIRIGARGTIFLDEVGDIPLELQPKLLRVLQEQEFERLGSVRSTHVDVRRVAATNVDMAQKVAANQFRSDLYYRLNVFPHPDPAASRTQRRHSVAGSIFCAEICAPHEKTHQFHSDESDGCANRVSLAGKRSRARKLHRARGDPVAQRRASNSFG